jgi:Fe-S-cluster-containing dehydrogenase component
MNDKGYICESCNKRVQIGDWPLCPHGKPHGMMTFIPYTDYMAGDKPIEVTSWKERQNLFKPKWNGDHIEQIVPRDLPDSHYRESRERLKQRQEDEKKERA